MTSSAPQSDLDVVICTYNNAAMLDGVLGNLARQQSVENSRWTCLVVNNNCTDHTDDIVRRHIAERAIPGLRSVRETVQGLTPARVCGVLSTTAKWTAFVDDDCFLEPDWIANAITFAKSHPTVGAFGGRVRLDWEGEPPAYLCSYGYSFAEQNHGDSERPVAFLAGAGLVVNRDAIAKCGWINGPLLADRVGKSLVSGGDVEIVLRISAADYALWYVPECRLHHRIPITRTRPAYLRDINRNLGVSQTLADALVYKGSDWRWILASFSKGADQIPGLLRLAYQAARRSRSMTDVSIQASFMLGRLLGMWRIFRMSPSRRHALVGRARPHGAIG